MRTSVLFLVFTLTGAQLLPASPREATSDPQTATTTARLRAQIRDRAQITQRPDRLALPDTIVPDLKGTSEEASSSLLAKSRLQAGRITTVDSDRPAGTIVGQQPEAGSRVRPGTAVDLFVSNGKARSHATGDRASRIDQLVAAGIRAGAGLATTDTVVPDLRSVPPRIWSSVLERRGLQLGRIVEHDADRPKGTLLEQHPNAGTRVKRGTAVDVEVSNGIRGAGDDVSSEPSAETAVRVPNVVGELIDPARLVLGKYRLRLGDVKWVESRRPYGTVIDQTPQPEQVVRVSSAVHVVVSQGPPRIVPAIVPAVVGEYLDAAVVEVRNATLQPGAIRSVPSKAAKGIVVGQSPAAGVRAQRDSLVHLDVSAGEPLVPVPNLVRGRIETVAAALETARLRIGTVTREDARPDAGTVIGQDPSPGSQVPPNTPVNIRVSLGEPLVIVPALVTLDLENATAAVRNANLVLGMVQRGEPRSRADIVLGQSLDAGSQVQRGTAINLVVSTEETLVVVPSLVQRSEQDARAAIATLRLQVGDVEQRETSTAAGIVLSQSVAPDTRVPRGTPIGLTISVPARLATVVLPSPPPPVAGPPSPPPAPPRSDIPPPIDGHPPVAPVDSWLPIPELPWSLIAGLGFSALYGIQRFRARGRRAPDSPKADTPQVPKIELLSHLDRGWQDIAFEDEDEAASAFELAFVEDAGIQRVVEGSNHDTEERHEYADTDAERSVRHRPRRAS